MPAAALHSFEMHLERDQYQIAGHEGGWITASWHEPPPLWAMRNEGRSSAKEREINANHCHVFSRCETHRWRNKLKKNFRQKDIFQNILCTVITRIVIYKTFQVDLSSNNFCLKLRTTIRINVFKEMEILETFPYLNRLETSFILFHDFISRVEKHPVQYSVTHTLVGLDIRIFRNFVVDV